MTLHKRIERRMNVVIDNQQLLEFVPSPVADVDIWMAQTELRSHKLAELAAMLSTDERAHEDIPAPRSGYERFALTRGLLRTVLGEYLDVEPGAVELTYGLNGKPLLAETFASSNIHFNLSHSGGIAVVAVARGFRVGLDIERLRFRADFSELSRRVLTERELEKLSTTLNACQRKTFYRYWVRKEAYLKGTGTGLAFPPRDVDVSAATFYRSDQPVTIPIVNDRPVPWRIYDLQLPGLGGTLVGALAIEETPLDRNNECSGDRIALQALERGGTNEEVAV